MKLGKLLLAAGGGLLLGSDEPRVTKGGLQLLSSFSFMLATCWFAGLYSFPQATCGRVGIFNCHWEN